MRLFTGWSNATTYMTASCVNYQYGYVTVSAPGPGVVIVEANAWVVLNHVVGTEDYLILAIDTSNTECYGTSVDQVVYDIGASEPSESGIYRTFTVRRAFPVAAGDTTFYLNGSVQDGNDDADFDVFYFASLHALFIPD